jgi:hypothetical protein
MYENRNRSLAPTILSILFILSTGLGLVLYRRQTSWQAHWTSNIPHHEAVPQLKTVQLVSASEAKSAQDEPD